MRIEGPYVEESSLRSLELLDDVNYVYVCTKPVHVKGQESGTSPS